MDEDELPPLVEASESEADPTDQMAGEPEDEDFFEADDDEPGPLTPRADDEQPVPGMVRALREQFEQVREPRESTSTIDSSILQTMNEEPENEVLVLSLKPSFKSQKGRELDPRFFSAAERAQFDKADTTNWKKHINLGAVEIIHPEEAERILRDRPQVVLPVPARFVRTAPTDESGDYEAKSRLVLPGHLLAKGAKYGYERTDSPTASLTSTYVGLTIVAHFGWGFEGFDVEAAFLTGKKMQREVYFKPPKGGLPGLPPGCLIRAVKGLFGVPEAPRLWYLEISETALKSGWRRVHATPCVFIVTNATGRLCGILILHVDDAILAGDGSEVYQKARKSLLSKLRIKKIQKNDIMHLKRRITRQGDGSIKIDFKDAVARLKPIYVSKKRRMEAEALVTEEERTQLRSLIGELAYPAREGFPQVSYDVSDLQQRVPEATVSTMARANSVLRHLQTLAAKQATLQFPRGDGTGRLALAAFADASFGRQPKGGSQQGFCALLGDRRVVSQYVDVPAALVNWSSTKIRRVVRSTLAAEASAFATGYDTAIWIRAMVSSILSPDDKRHWSERIYDVPQLNFNDCKSLVDMAAKEGGLPSEKRTALDFHDVRQYLDQDDLEHISTNIMLADALTKHKSATEHTSLDSYLETGLFSVQ